VTDVPINTAIATAENKTLLIFLTPWLVNEIPRGIRGEFRAHCINFSQNDKREPPRSIAMRSKFLSWFGRLAPFNGRVVEAKRLLHKRTRFVELFYRCAGPVSCFASGGVAIAPQRDPFFSSQYVADTDRFLGVRWIDCATLI
jgi:hypothetical protein